MNKAIKLTIRLALCIVMAPMAGCVTTQSDYEIRLFMNKGGDVDGYVRIEGVRHSIKGEYDE